MKRGLPCIQIKIRFYLGVVHERKINPDHANGAALGSEKRSDYSENEPLLLVAMKLPKSDTQTEAFIAGIAVSRERETREPNSCSDRQKEPAKSSFYD